MQTSKNIILTALSPPVLLGYAGAKNEDKPGIVWICAEDITTMPGCYGDEIAPTPNLNAFATRSEKLTNACATGYTGNADAQSSKPNIILVLIRMFQEESTQRHQKLTRNRVKI